MRAVGAGGPARPVFGPVTVGVRGWWMLGTAIVLLAACAGPPRCGPRNATAPIVSDRISSQTSTPGTREQTAPPVASPRLAVQKPLVSAIPSNPVIQSATQVHSNARTVKPSLTPTMQRFPTPTAEQSPDGTIFLYAVNRGELYMMDASCTRSPLGCIHGWIRLTEWQKDQRSPMAGGDLSVSPDGRYLAFTQWYRSDEAIVAHKEVRILDVERCRLLPSGCRYDQTLLLTGLPTYEADDASWSPHGQEIALRLTSPVFDGLAIVTADGTTYEELLPRVSLSTFANVGNPAWSPDGGTLAFTATHGTYRHADTYIYTVDLDGSDLTQITDFPHEEPLHKMDQDPDWAPDGRRLVFSSDHRHEGWQEDYSTDYLYTMKPDGSGITPLGVEGMRPKWSPDGSRVLTCT